MNEFGLFSASPSDTLHIPLFDRGVSVSDVQLPQYYQQSFFSSDSLFHPELPGGRYGTAGESVPYSLAGDDIVSSLLLVCFLLSVLFLSRMRRFLGRQVRDFFRPPVRTADFETGSEMHFQLFFVILNSLLLTLLYYFYVLRVVADVFVLDSQHVLIAIFLAIFLAYFLIRTLLYLIVNSVFFGSKKNIQWQRALPLLSVLESILLFPAVFVQAYSDISIQNVVIYFAVVLVFVKLLTIYKAYDIFFRRNVVHLQIILYFCALEVVPLLALWGVLGITANSLKINF